MLIDECPTPSTAGSVGQTVAEVAEAKIKYYRNIRRADWPAFEKMLQWWNSRTSREYIPCLSQVTLAFLGYKPLAGHLQCNFGSLNDVLATKRASLSQGIVKVEMVLKLNKHLFLSKPEAVVTLPNDGWKTHTPNLPRDEEELVGTDEDVEEDQAGSTMDEVDIKVEKENEEEEKEEESVRLSECKDTEEEEDSTYDSADSTVIAATLKEKWPKTSVTLEPDMQTSTIAVSNEQETCDM